MTPPLPATLIPTGTRRRMAPCLSSSCNPNRSEDAMVHLLEDVPPVAREGMLVAWYQGGLIRLDDAVTLQSYLCL